MPALVSRERGIGANQELPRLVQFLGGQSLEPQPRQLLVDRRDGAIDIGLADTGANHQRAFDDVPVEGARHVIRHALPLSNAVAQPPANRILPQRIVHQPVPRSTCGSARAMVVNPYATSACALFIIGMTTRRRSAAGGTRAAAEQAAAERCANHRRCGRPPRARARTPRRQPRPPSAHSAQSAARAVARARRAWRLSTAWTLPFTRRP